MPLGREEGEGGGGIWSEYRLLVVSELERANKAIEEVKKEVSALRMDVGMLKLKAGIIGAVGGIVFGALVSWLLAKH